MTATIIKILFRLFSKGRSKHTIVYVGIVMKNCRNRPCYVLGCAGCLFVQAHLIASNAFTKSLIERAVIGIPTVAAFHFSVSKNLSNS
jgi:hypothetical protein